ncbi:thioredoxin-like protein [Butyriboletus roseoflavus]|nr:thioredoxin-like protein [Butyriboletus roseoflavus]
MDAKINSLASRVVESNRSQEVTNDDDDESIFAELEAEIENADSVAFREHALGQLRLQCVLNSLLGYLAKVNVVFIRANKLKEMHQNAHGSYTEITNEKEVIRISANEPRCVVHFYHSNFRRCEIMDKHLAKLAPRYFATRFIRVFVENVPWLVERLSIKVLPCVTCFVDGVSKDRLVGFEELGNSDVFKTAVLELRLSQSGVLQKAESSLSLNDGELARDSVRKGNEDEEEFDLDD